MQLVNGEESDQIAVADRGFQYGDGLFETILVMQGKPLFFERHLNRLEAGAARIKIPIPDRNQLIEEANKVSKNAEKAVLKLIVTRGSGGRGYRQPYKILPTRVVSLHPFPNYPECFYSTGLTTRICSTPLGLSPILAGIKHMNRLEQILARSEWSDSNIHEGIMLNLNGHVIEGTASNVFYIKNEVICTAKLNLSGVAGITRGLLLEQLNAQKIPCLIHDYYQQDLLAADEAFVCNSIMGICPIKKLDNVEFKRQNITRQLMANLIKHREKELLHGS